MRCFMCKGRLLNQIKTYMVEVENCIIIVKNVPAQVCGQCGEISYSHNIAIQLENIVTSLRSSITEIAVANYSNEVA